MTETIHFYSHACSFLLDRPAVRIAWPHDDQIGAVKYLIKVGKMLVPERPTVGFHFRCCMKQKVCDSPKDFR